MLICWAGLWPNLPPQIIRIYKPKDEGGFRWHAVFMRTFPAVSLLVFCFSTLFPYIYTRSISFNSLRFIGTTLLCVEIPQLENKRGNQFVHSVNNNLYSKCNKDRKKWKEIKRIRMQAQFMCSSAKMIFKKMGGIKFSSQPCTFLPLPHNLFPSCLNEWGSFFVFN